jgi:two-component system LytT family sensor kinase
VTPSKRPSERASLALWILATWTAIGLLLAAQSYVSGHLQGDGAPPVVPAIRVWLSWAYTWALLTPVVLALHQRLLAHRFALLVHVGAAPVFALVNLAIFAFLAPALGAQNTASTWLGTLRNLLGSAFVVNVPLYLLIVGVAHWRHVARTARERATRELALERQLAEARLITLRAQLQPHFLFNALNTISVLMREEVDRAERVLLDLSSLLRSVLQASDATFSPLSQECALARTYLSVEQARFGERLDFRFEIDPAAASALVPSLLLQPLVENCVRHAVNARLEPTRIVVTALRRGASLELAVRDNGPGLGPPRPAGVGLSNTRARLALLYPGQDAFTIRNGADGGVEVLIAIPWQDTDDDPHPGD